MDFEVINRKDIPSFGAINSSKVNSSKRSISNRIYKAAKKNIIKAAGTTAVVYYLSSSKVITAITYPIASRIFSFAYPVITYLAGKAVDPVVKYVHSRVNYKKI